MVVIWMIEGSCQYLWELRLDLINTRRQIVAQYMVVHSLKVPADQFSQAMEDDSITEFAKAMQAGETPAKCVKSWNPLPYGNTDTFICLWEANNEEDIVATLGEMIEMITCEPMEVDEIDWAQIAAS